MAAHGPAPDGAPYALHSCDNPACFLPAHLRWGTHSENMQDKALRGERRINLKLTPEQVTEIRHALSGGETCTSIGRRYGVHQVTVSRIKSGKLWNHL